MDESFEPVLRAFLDCLPIEWLAGELHVIRVASPGGSEKLRLSITHPKGKPGECGPADKLAGCLARFVGTAPKGWTSFHVKVKRKRAGGWDVHKEFRTDDPPPDEDGPVNDWVANSRQMEFGKRLLGTVTRVCVRHKRGVGWIMEESKWFLFIPLGTTTTKLGRADRIHAYADLGTGKQVVELSVFGRPSTLVYEGYNLQRQKWLVETLQQILCVPVETTKVMTR